MPALQSFRAGRYLIVHTKLPRNVSIHSVNQHVYFWNSDDDIMHEGSYPGVDVLVEYIGPGQEVQNLASTDNFIKPNTGMHPIRKQRERFDTTYTSSISNCTSRGDIHEIISPHTSDNNQTRNSALFKNLPSKFSHEDRNIAKSPLLSPYATPKKHIPKDVRDCRDVVGLLKSDDKGTKNTFKTSQASSMAFSAPSFSHDDKNIAKSPLLSPYATPKKHIPKDVRDCRDAVDLLKSDDKGTKDTFKTSQASTTKLSAPSFSHDDGNIAKSPLLSPYATPKKHIPKDVRDCRDVVDLSLSSDDEDARKVAMYTSRDKSTNRKGSLKDDRKYGCDDAHILNSKCEKRKTPIYLPESDEILFLSNKAPKISEASPVEVSGYLQNPPSRRSTTAPDWNVSSLLESKDLSVYEASDFTSALSDEIPTPPIPRAITDNKWGKLYPDLRNHFIKHCIKQIWRLKGNHNQKSLVDSLSRAIVHITLYRFPLASGKAAEGMVKGIGPMIGKNLEECKEDNYVYQPPPNRHASAAGATLEILLDHERGGKDNILSMELLFAKIPDYVHFRTRPDLKGPLNEYISRKRLDPSWLQIQALVRLGYVKQRSNKKHCQSGVVFELTENGRQEAIEMKERMILRAGRELFPLRQLVSRSVSSCYANLTVVIDFREGGGPSNNLHNFCNHLDCRRVPFVVRELKISDYVFFYGDHIAPYFVERKSLVDVAGSLADNRWENQKINMKKARAVLGTTCKLYYIIEGDLERMDQVHGGYVGRAEWKKKPEDVKRAIASLHKEGFKVIHTKDYRGSLNEIATIAKEVVKNAKSRSITCTHTYPDFEQLMKQKSHYNEMISYQHRLHDNVGSAAQTVSVDRHDFPSVITQTNGINKSLEKEYLKCTNKQLKEICKQRVLKCTGNKSELIQRLLAKDPRPKILIERARKDHYVPKVPSCNAAILVALLLNPNTSMEKDDLMSSANDNGISEGKMYGQGRGGPYTYDGWSGMKQMTHETPHLIHSRRRQYSLTEEGKEIADAIHILAHRKNLCKCGRNIN